MTGFGDPSPDGPPPIGSDPPGPVSAGGGLDGDSDGALRSAVLRRLALLDEAADTADASTLLPLARSEITRLAQGWRLLLTVHQPDEGGRCPACPAVAWRGGRGRSWPCPVWRMAHDHLIGEGMVLRRGRRRRAELPVDGVVRGAGGEVVARLYPAPRAHPG
ncbi:hypothetical protein [Actinokineospora spheciospongiae]|uniref:hypothetical protein n=1 Tax=Actinokineospora spheciospongiae TaxID=909613 RepID=UPI000D8B2AA7|nr:hypothetical protein [Actinokineospora spheciospongiae]PWW64647.1 hypothetical protein DFQ13_103621 [Actinokineospora spheciospongiae]